MDGRQAHWTQRTENYLTDAERMARGLRNGVTVRYEDKFGVTYRGVIRYMGQWGLATCAYVERGQGFMDVIPATALRVVDK